MHFLHSVLCYQRAAKKLRKKQQNVEIKLVLHNAMICNMMIFNPQKSAHPNVRAM